MSSLSRERVLGWQFCLFLRFGCWTEFSLEANFHRALSTLAQRRARCRDNERKLSLHPYFWYPKARKMEIHWIMNTENDKFGNFASHTETRPFVSASDSLSCKTCKVAANSNWKMAYHCSELLILHFSCRNRLRLKNTAETTGEKMVKKNSRTFITSCAPHVAEILT